MASFLIATPQTGIDSILATCIDYWIDHPEERYEMGWRYARSTEEYDIHKSIEALIDMFRAARGKAM